MKHLIQLSFIFLIASFTISCNTLESEQGPKTLILQAGNNTDVDFENFSFSVYDQISGEEKVLTFGDIAAGETTELTYALELGYMHYEGSDEYIHFGNSFHVTKNGVEIAYNYGICGTGLTFSQTDSGIFLTNVDYLDDELEFIGISQSKL